MLGDGVVKLHNLERGDDQKLKGVNKPETNLLERQSKRDLVPMRICAKPYIMSERNRKIFNGPNPTRFRLTGLFTLKKEYRKTLKLCYFIPRKLLRVATENSFPLGKVTVTLVQWKVKSC